MSARRRFAIVPTVGCYGGMDYVSPVETHDDMEVAQGRALRLTREYQREMSKYAAGQRSGYRVVSTDSSDDDGEWMGHALDQVPTEVQQ